MFISNTSAPLSEARLHFEKYKKKLRQMLVDEKRWKWHVVSPEDTSETNRIFLFLMSYRHEVGYSKSASCISCTRMFRGSSSEGVFFVKLI